MRLIIIFLAFALSNCGYGLRWSELPVDVNIDPAIETKAIEAIAKLNQHFKAFQISDAGQIAIVCDDTIAKLGNAHIVYDGDIKYCEIQLRCDREITAVIIAHELLHCIGFEHSENPDCLNYISPVPDVPISTLICDEIINEFADLYPERRRS